MQHPKRNSWRHWTHAEDGRSATHQFTGLVACRNGAYRVGYDPANVNAVRATYLAEPEAALHALTRMAWLKASGRYLFLKKLPRLRAQAEAHAAHGP